MTSCILLMKFIAPSLSIKGINGQYWLFSIVSYHLCMDCKQNFGGWPSNSTSHAFLLFYLKKDWGHITKMIFKFLVSRVSIRFGRESAARMN